MPRIGEGAMTMSQWRNFQLATKHNNPAQVNIGQTSPLQSISAFQQAQHGITTDDSETSQTQQRHEHAQ